MPRDTARRFSREAYSVRPPWGSTAEGLTIYYGPNLEGYVLASSQGDATFTLYERNGTIPISAASKSRLQASVAWTACKQATGRRSSTCRSTICFITAFWSSTMARTLRKSSMTQGRSVRTRTLNLSAGRLSPRPSIHPSSSTAIVGIRGKGAGRSAQDDRKSCHCRRPEAP
jgi:Phytase